jgi:hypothetical protein
MVDGTVVEVVVVGAVAPVVTAAMVVVVGAERVVVGDSAVVVSAVVPLQARTAIRESAGRQRLIGVSLCRLPDQPDRLGDATVPRGAVSG